MSRTLGAPENQVHLSSLISDRDETRTEVCQSGGWLHGSTSSNEWQHEASTSSPVGSEEMAGSDDNEVRLSAAISLKLWQSYTPATIAPSTGGGGGGNDRGWNDEDKEKNKKKRNGGMRR